MNPQSEHRQEVRRVLLPSGKSVEVVPFQAGTSPPPPSRETGLHVCPRCACELVQPVDWEEQTRTCWRIDLRCPNCRWTNSGVWGEEAVDAFDELLDTGTQTLLRDLRRLTRANLEDEIDRFTVALRDGAILPEDF